MYWSQGAGEGGGEARIPTPAHDDEGDHADDADDDDDDDEEDGW